MCTCAVCNLLSCVILWFCRVLVVFHLRDSKKEDPLPIRPIFTMNPTARVGNFGSDAIVVRDGRQNSMPLHPIFSEGDEHDAVADAIAGAH